MSVVTFYSYKGGVGRSMALANVAVLLAQRGHRVLVVDWDLEAPGIEKYFADLRLTQSGLGLLPLLRDVASGSDPNYVDFTWKVSALDGAFEFSFLHSGREADPEYFQHLEQFRWQTFFDRGGGNYLEALRERWLEDFEFVLVDSRTGLSDAGGVCTIQLPDIIVALFTPARQSLFGVRDVMRLAQSARHRLAFDREALSVIPVPSRVDREQQSFIQWMDTFATELKEFFLEWLPKESDRRQVLERLTLDHVPSVAHGERLGVLQRDPDCEALVSTYERLTTVLASDLRDVSPLIATQTAARGTAKKTTSVRRRSKQPQGERTRLATLEYEHDLYLSYPRSALTTEWMVEHFLPLMQARLELERGTQTDIFFDRAEITAGMEWVETQRRALLRSRLLLGIWSPSYFASRWCLAEFATFRRRSELEYRNLIVPITIHGGASFPAEAQTTQWFDFREFMIVGKAFNRSEKYLDFEDVVRKLCGHIASQLKNVPQFDSSWPIVEPKDEAVTTAAPPRITL